MTIADATKKKILAAIAANRSNYPSDAKHATALGLEERSDRKGIE